MLAAFQRTIVTGAGLTKLDSTDEGYMCVHFPTLAIFCRFGIFQDKKLEKKRNILVCA